MMTPFKELSEKYLAYLVMRNYRPSTLKNIVCDLRRLESYLQDEKQLDDPRRVTTPTLRDWQMWLHQLPSIRGGGRRSAASLNREMASISGFFLWLKIEGYIGTNPARPLEYAKVPKTLPLNVLSVEEVQRILRQPDTGTVIGYRDRTILEVLYSTGIRKGELCNLEQEDVKLSEGHLVIREGKGMRDRVVPLGQLACRYVETYQRAVRPALTGFGDTGHLFLSLRSRRMSKNTPLGVVQKYAQMAGIEKPVTCHMWRHSCATHMVKNNANLRCVQQMLGHGNLSTTERYLHLTITDLKEAHRKCHPRGSVEG